MPSMNARGASISSPISPRPSSGSCSGFRSMSPRRAAARHRGRRLAQRRHVAGCARVRRCVLRREHSAQRHAAHRRAAAVLSVMLPNQLDAAHPYARYLDEHVRPEFGTIAAADGQTMHYKLLKPRNLEAGKRYPVLVDVYGGPGAQRVSNAWGSLFHQYLVQHGYVVFTLDNRGSGMRGERFETALGLRMGDIEVQDQVTRCRIPARPALRRREAHRHVRLELRRLHDADVPDAGAGCVRGGRRRRAGHRLGALRHALHRALPIYSRGECRRLPPEQRAAVRGPAVSGRCCWCTAWPTTTCCSRTAPRS